MPDRIQKRKFTKGIVICITGLSGVALLLTLSCSSLPPGISDSTAPPPTVAFIAPLEPEPGPEPSPESESPPMPESAQEPSPMPDPGRYKVNPLTGESVNSAGDPWDETISRNRPWGISIDNVSAAMPMWGVSDADIFCEYVVEMVATRIVAIYQDISGTGRIGSIRSLRTSGMEIASGFDAIFAHWIGRTYHNEVSNGKGGTAITDFGTVDAALLGTRDPGKTAPNDAIVNSGARLINALPDSFRTELDDNFEHSFRFKDDGKPAGGLPAESVTVSFSKETSKTTEFRYRSSDGKYTFRQFGRDMTDGNNDKLLGFTNIIIIRTYLEHKFNPSGHTYVGTTGEGKGYYVNGGKFVSITWSREDLSSPYSFFSDNGQPLEIGVGKTFICFVHSDQIPVFK